MYRWGENKVHEEIADTWMRKRKRIKIKRKRNHQKKNSEQQLVDMLSSRKNLIKWLTPIELISLTFSWNSKIWPSTSSVLLCSTVDILKTTSSSTLSSQKYFIKRYWLTLHLIINFMTGLSSYIRSFDSELFGACLMLTYIWPHR